MRSGEELQSHFIIYIVELVQRLEVVRMGELRNVLKLLTGKPTEKKVLTCRIKRRLEANVRIDLNKISAIVINWNNEGQDSDYWNTVLYLRVL